MHFLVILATNPSLAGTALGKCALGENEATDFREHQLEPLVTAVRVLRCASLWLPHSEITLNLY